MSVFHSISGIEAIMLLKVKNGLHQIFQNSLRLIIDYLFHLYMLLYFNALDLIRTRF